MTDEPRPNPLLDRLLHLGPLAPVAARLGLLAQVGILTRVRGTRHTPRRGPLVVAASHPSSFDVTFVDAAIPRRVEVIRDDDFLAVPIVRSSLARSRPLRSCW